MSKIHLYGSLCLAAGLLLTLTGCAEPAQPAPAGPAATDKPPATAAPAAAAVKPAPEKPAVTDELPLADAKKPLEEQVLTHVKLLIAKLEAKDYRWMYDHALPPAEAKSYHDEKPFAEFTREFVDKGADKVLLEALKTIQDVDVETSEAGKADTTKVVIRWKDSWPKHNDLIFVKIDGRWYLAH